jgi:phenylalanyl-tRNA synthetase beta chain
MKFSENWLREWVNIPTGITEWSEKLTAAGLEVEELIPLGAGLKNVCIGHVLYVHPHPNADRLNVCEVAIDHSGKLLTIVCGAANVRIGLKVAVAQLGAELPGAIQIKQTKIRGVESFGMICSTAELGLGDTATGIMELPVDAPVGMTFSEYLGLPDHILDINLTPNRGDCLSVAGLARELSAIAHSPLTPVAIIETPATIAQVLPITLQVAGCPHYIGRIVKDLRLDAVTPLWMQERLYRSNIRPKHPVVDIMNYVMLELGQPLHAFDLMTIAQEITVRHSEPDEKIALLDGQTFTLEKPALVIADEEKILALAGIMGSAASSVTEKTTDIFIESAFFTPEAIRTTLRELHLQSDAAHRFERGVDPMLAIAAMHRASELLLNICGGQAAPIIDVINKAQVAKPSKILLRAARIERILGIKLCKESIEDLLQRLNLLTETCAEGWQVTVPSYRFDLHKEIDLIEEVARLYGYTQIPSKNLSASLVMHPALETQLTPARLRHYFADQGYHETINYSFVDPKLADLFNPENKALLLSNPIAADMSAMRTSLWPGLVQAALFNLNRQQSNLRFFEMGVCFFPDTDAIKHIPTLAGVVLGSAFPEQWALKKQPVDFFDVKSDLENLLALTKENNFEFVKGAHPALHPGRCAAIQRAGKKIGYVGELHPELQQKLDIPCPMYLFELTAAELLPAALPSYTTPSRYPSMRRDLAFIVKEQITYAQIAATICKAAGEALQDLQLFDIYKGTGIAPEHKSFAFSLNFQLCSRTLTDEEIDNAVKQVITGLQKNFGATLRE